MQDRLSGLPLRALLAAALVCAVAPAFAISLGEVEVRSALGEALDARIALGLAAGEVVDANCFALARDPEPGVPVVSEGLLTVERAAERTALRIRSNGPVFEPAVRLRVRAACPGAAGETLRQYSVLLDPRRGDPVVANLPTVSARLDARTGDTLEGLARKVFPRSATARARYLEAMREVNPALASLGNDDPIPDGANVALPDLRTFARTVPAASAPQTERPARPRKAPRTHHAARAASSPPVRASAPAPKGDGFVLRLSGGDIDLNASRQVDDRTREQLRERLLILDSDDQVAAVLALRNRLTQLEARVNELQLKLAGMPASFPARADAEAAPAKAAEAAEHAAAPAKVVETTEPTPAAKAVPALPQPRTAVPAREPRQAPSFDYVALWKAYGVWGAFILALALFMVFIWRVSARREHGAEQYAWNQPAPDQTQLLPEAAAEAEPSAAALAPPDAGALRQRYVEERFPEVLNGTLVLNDPASVVKVARLFYEDGALPRAVELLQFAIEDDPAEVRTWLALFEIYRLERLTGEFATLARRFYEQHGDTDHWRKIRYFGREIDPGNLLYREEIDALETIGPGTSRRAVLDRFDPVRENWLDAPMHFDNEVLANELRQALMASAGVTDKDLVPNPMPALRDAEMFTVA